MGEFKTAVANSNVLNYLSLNRTMSGQIQDGAKLFYVEKGVN